MYEAMLLLPQEGTLGKHLWYDCVQDGATALHMAAQEGHVDIVEALTKAQAQINIQTEVRTYAPPYTHWCNP